MMMVAVGREARNRSGPPRDSKTLPRLEITAGMGEGGGRS
jgi:hypothetical protein